MNLQYQNMKLYQTKIEPTKSNSDEKYMYKELDNVNDDQSSNSYNSSQQSSDNSIKLE